MDEEDNKPADAETEAIERENFAWRLRQYWNEQVEPPAGNRRRQVDWERMPSMRSWLYQR